MISCLLSRCKTPSSWTTPWRLTVLLVVSFVLVVCFEYANLPAALLLGPMITAIMLATSGAGITLPKPMFLMAQGILGMMIANSLPLTVFAKISQEWPLFLIGTVSTIVTSSFLGWLLSRTGLLPGTTAIWGSSPGAASAMTIMSESYGADMRLVAFMQYLRVACCAIAATVVATVFHVDELIVEPTDWLGVSSWSGFTLTLAIILVACVAGVILRLPSGPMLLALAVGLMIKFSGILPIVLPNWCLAISFAVLGWSIGFRFTRQVLRHAWYVFPHVLGAILALIAINACVAMLLISFADIDPLTAFLATSPGGADSVAIIAASTRADVSFVMAMQVARFLLVLLAGPMLARWLSSIKAI
ncbi:AbrB family transcriptional regulator [Marinomonas sp. M1K-6]|uniref:AbrB family transcriptional regulator n=1 Tax=Marinomonas profundi TaxID=2726122 RepID=A0A847R988_9GAMM|nr:AbrB family transcriptional regulator [Marinomonas profundi]NLQ17747.1 AbrB family transcriptional regulator [Marinomonas profundi]UDV04304.1 AbrB family transcriptional regulator [Marinomonas profundi]